MTYETWHMTHDTWHMTYDMWHVTCDTWLMKKKIRKKVLSVCFCLFWYQWYYPHTSTDSVSLVCRILYSLNKLCDHFCDFFWGRVLYRPRSKVVLSQAGQYSMGALTVLFLKASTMTLVCSGPNCPIAPSAWASKGRGSPLLIYLSLSYLFIYSGRADSRY